MLPFACWSQRALRRPAAAAAAVVAAAVAGAVDFDQTSLIAAEVAAAAGRRGPVLARSPCLPRKAYT